MMRETFDSGAFEIAGETRVALMRWILENHQHRTIEGRDVDVQSANAYLTVHDALKPANQANLNACDIGSAISICWTLLTRSES